MVIILLAIVLLVPELYIWHHFVRNAQWYWQVLYWLPYVATMLTMGLVQTPLYQAWMFRVGLTLLMCISIPKVLFAIFSAIGLGIGKWVPMASRVMDGVGVVVALSLLGIVAYGLSVGWKRLTVHEVELTFDDLPKEFDGYRIVQISDLHIGTFNTDTEVVDAMVKNVNEAKADMICFTGDLVNASPEELNPFVDILKQMHAKDGIYSIMGNHDYCKYRRYKNAADTLATIRQLQQMERSMGWQMLLNENRMIHRGTDSLMLAGVENSSKPPFPDYGNLPKALGDGAPFTILLSHDPTHWRREVLPKSKVQLQLSGHTHSTQFKMFGWSPASFTYKEYAGLYEMLKDGTETFNPDVPSASSRKLYVSTGTGGNFAFRFGVWPEIVIITLKRS